MSATATIENQMQDTLPVTEDRLEFRNFKVTAKHNVRDSVTGRVIYSHSVIFHNANKSIADATKEAQDAVSHYMADRNVGYVVVEKIAKRFDADGNHIGLYIEKTMWYRKNGQFNHKPLDSVTVNFGDGDPTNSGNVDSEGVSVNTLD